MIDRNYILNLVKSKDITIDEFNFDKLTCPPIHAYFTDYDLYRLYDIVTSIKYSAKPRVKYDKIDEIMKSRGFVKLSAGTNRLVYRCIENDTFVAKIPYNIKGMDDNPKEFINQNYLKPFCAKTFEVAMNGIMAFSERVNPITNREEFLSIAEDIFILISEFLIDGTRVLDDIGTKFFMNYGIRSGVCPVLLDYSFYYPLDGNKLYCNRPDPTTESGFCGYTLDYDDGYNNIICKKCGSIYRAKDLALKIKENQIITKSFKGEFNKMKVKLKGGSKNLDVTTTINTIEVEEPKQVTSEETVYTEKKRNIHVSLGHRNEEPEIEVVNNKVLTESIKPVVEEAVKEEIKTEEPAKEIEVKEVVTPVLSSPIKVGNDEKEDKDIIRDKIFDIAKTISANQIQGTASVQYLLEVLKNLKFVIETLRSTSEWQVNHEDELLNIFLSSDKISTNITQNDAGIVTSEITYEDDESIYILHSDQFVVTCNPIEIDEEDNNEEPAKEIKVEDNIVNNNDENEEESYDEYEIDDTYIDDEYEDNEIQINGYVPFSAKIIDISSKISTEESHDILLIDDGNGGFLTIGDGTKYLGIDRINGFDINESCIVSKVFINNVLTETQDKSVEITKDTFTENATVNGVSESNKEK